MVVVTQEEDLLVEISAEEVAARTTGRSGPWRSLDVVALHEVVLPEVFPDGIHDIVYTKEPKEIARLVVQEKWSAGVLLRPPAPGCGMCGCSSTRRESGPTLRSFVGSTGSPDTDRQRPYQRHRCGQSQP
jgi:hypothetical protein